MLVNLKREILIVLLEDLERRDYIAKLDLYLNNNPSLKKRLVNSIESSKDNTKEIEIELKEEEIEEYIARLDLEVYYTIKEIEVFKEEKKRYEELKELRKDKEILRSYYCYYWYRRELSKEEIEKYIEMLKEYITKERQYIRIL